MGCNHKPESIENNCSDKDEDAMVAVEGKRESCRRRYSYSVWAIPPADVSHRIKKVMEGLRAEFGAFPCKQFYAIFKPPLREVDGRRGKKLENWLMLWMYEGITSLTFRVTCFAVYEIDYGDQSLKSLDED
ncbi:uncharacterized protein [Pyrus communis]|uniref:uncharacterized protein n=1 Tax=Pyrus communis TaxID=23211 RepID=UPI0035C0F23B